MKRILSTALALATIALATIQVHAENDRIVSPRPDKILFVGSSLTSHGGGIHHYFERLCLAAADPDTFDIDAEILGGQGVEGQWKAGNVQGIITAGDYDAVIMQQMPYGFTPADGGADDDYYYAELLINHIEGTGALPVWYMTWNRAGYSWAEVPAAVESVEATWPQVPIVPVGFVWEEVMVERPQLRLYQDGVHPSVAGAYLASCLFYSSFTGKSPVGNPYFPSDSINAEAAAYIQGAAWDHMRDYIEPACLSMQPPSVPGALVANGVSTSENYLTWDASTHTVCGLRKYNIYRDGDFVTSSYQSGYTDGGLDPKTEYTYTISAVSLGNVESAQSAGVDCSTLEDTTPPELLTVYNARYTDTLILVFSEELDAATAEVAGNYAIDNGITVSAAVLDGKEVTLTVSTLTAEVDYTVTVTNVTDNAPAKNAVAANTEGLFVYVPLIHMANCIGYWPFDYTLDDFSGNGSRGQWINGENYSRGYHYGCVEMTGSAYTWYPMLHSMTIPAGMSEISCAAWFKKAYPDSGGTVVLRNSVFQLSVSAGGVNSYISTDTGGKVKCNISTAAVSDTAWHHLAVTYDGSTIRLYLDAVELKSVAQSGDVASGNTSINVGKVPYGDALTFFGKIDEFRVYDAALDSAGIAAIYNDDPSGPVVGMRDAVVPARMDHGAADGMFLDMRGRRVSGGRTGIYLQRTAEGLKKVLVIE